jgi:hypothetical protein
MNAIGDRLPRKLAPYVRREYRSLVGRAGRGRLWTDSKFGAVAIDPWPNSALARWCEQCGGIVIKESDAHGLVTLPGILTDLALNRVSTDKEIGVM